MITYSWRSISVGHIYHMVNAYKQCGTKLVIPALTKVKAILSLTWQLFQIQATEQLNENRETNTKRWVIRIFCGYKQVNNAFALSWHFI